MTDDMFLYYSMSAQPSITTHFPYTTLFRSTYNQGVQADALPGTGGAGHQKVGHLIQGSHHRRPGKDRKSTRLNSSHVRISYAVFCLKKKKFPVMNYTLIHSYSLSLCYCVVF